MSTVLRIAGVYSLSLALLAVAAPGVVLSLMDWDPDALSKPALQLFQVATLLTAVTGLGYLLAASDAFRHWPIVMMGFAAKAITCCAIAGEISKGRLPVKAAWFAFVDDLIWLIPLGLILNGAHEALLGRRRTVPKEILRFAMRR